MVSVAASGNTLWVYDPSLVSYALEQPQMLRSPENIGTNAVWAHCTVFKFIPMRF